MSDVSHGPGWWIASDGKWYPPELYPYAPAAQSASADQPYKCPGGWLLVPPGSEVRGKGNRIGSSGRDLPHRTVRPMFPLAKIRRH